MTLLSEQVSRIRDILQEINTDPTITAKIIAAHQESLQVLARKDAFSQVQWVNAISGQALYTLANPTVTISHVLYNERALRYATEITLDRRFHGWEALSGEPTYWTVHNQIPNTIRVVPSPTRTGSTVPVIPSPLVQDMNDNLVVFHSEDVSDDVRELTDVLPTLFDWDDLLVFKTARMFAERETHEQNLPVAALCLQLEGLWEKFLMRSFL